MTGELIPGENTLLGGRYRLQQRLGSGGMAAVWAARDERLGRDVAVKVLSDVLAGDPDYRRRFEREARVAASLSHPALVGVLDFGAESERPFLVMELVRGETLAQRMAGGRARDLDLRALARELLGALAHIHAGGIVHRDVKPANVLLGPDGRARLTDFGIAQPADATALTQTGQVIGTASYMAPEVRRGEPASARSDVYSLGIVLREAGGGDDAVLDPLIARLTASDPGERPASAEEAAAALTDTAATLPRPATEATERLGRTQPTAVLADARGPARPERPLLGQAAVFAVLAALAVAALVLALTGGDDGGNRTDAPQSGAREEARGSSPPEEEPEPAPAPDPSQETPEEPQEDCAAVEEETKALEEEKKAAEEGAGDDKEAKKAIKTQFEARKQELEQRAQGCGES